MARINFEDDVESQDEFWELIKFCDGDRVSALGRLVLFFRIAQKAYAFDEPMSQETLIKKGLGMMIESGWAVPVEGGFQSLGAAKHFDWYRQKVAASRKGGEANKQRHGAYRLAERLPPDSPLAPAPALSKKRKKKEEGGVGETASVEALPSLKVVKREDGEIDEVVRELLPVLAQATGTKFLETGQELRQGVSKLLKAGYTSKDMAIVIKHRSVKWRADPKMADYLRPATLFRLGKFEEYLAMGRSYFDKVEEIFGAM